MYTDTTVKPCHFVELWQALSWWWPPRRSPRAVAVPALSMSSRLTLVVGAALDIVGLGALFLQQTGEYRGDLPVDLPSLRSRLDHTLLDHDWFPWLVAASVFPVLGAAGAVCLWRPLLWLYCAFLVACIGAHARWTCGALAALLGSHAALLTPPAHGAHRPANDPDISRERQGGARAARASAAGHVLALRRHLPASLPVPLGGAPGALSRRADVSQDCNGAALVAATRLAKRKAQLKQDKVATAL